MLTALEEPAAVIEGMNAGADDYVAKSVDFDVIKARLRAQLRRKQFEDENRRVREEVLKKNAEANAARELAEARAVLLQQLEARNLDLEILNRELKMFAYSVSHDLRQPLRSMDGFSKVLLDKYGDHLDDKGRHYLERIRTGAQRMGELIDGLLVLSHVSRKKLHHEPLRLDALAHAVVGRLKDSEPHREVEIDVADPIEAFGDKQLVESVLENLLGNAWKFSSGRSPARISVGVNVERGVCTYFVRDNGAGFKMDYVDKLFAPFQRLHSDNEFPGTGIGLATTQRIVHRHGGRIWAEGRPGEGATIYFTLAATPEEERNG
jgi:light-regulated signal transduction histidine kinase (bacteriophytochrome)